MGDDGVSLLLKQFTQQVLDQVKDQGDHISELLRSVDKISGKQDQIEEKIDTAQVRFANHEIVHLALNKRVSELEIEQTLRDREQKNRDRLANGIWVLVGGALTSAVGYLLSWPTHK